MQQVCNDCLSPAANNVFPGEWAWQLAFNNDVSLDMKVECFLKSNNPSKAFQLKDTQEVLRFFDDYLPDHPVYIFRLGQDNRLRFHVTLNKASRFVIDRVISCSIKPPDEDYVEIEMRQSCQNNVTEILALLRPSSFKSARLNNISPYFGLVDVKYVNLLIRIRLALTAPFAQEIDLYQPLYCKVIHPQCRLRFHRLVGMFENQDEHDVNA